MFSQEERAKIIGGSDIAAIMGLNRWETPLSLWAKKTGKVEPFESNEAMELGTELEDFVAQKFSKRQDLKVRRDSRQFKHPKYDYMVAHIDRWIVATDALLECKTCGAWKAKEWEGEEIPIEYVLQVNWYLGIVGKTTGWLAVLIGGQRFMVKSIEFDQDLFDKQVAAAKAFMETFIRKDVAPMAIPGDTDTLLALFPGSSGQILDVTDPEMVDDLNTAVAHKMELKREADEIAAEIDGIDVTLKEKIGENDGFKTDKYKITWKPQTSRRIDVQAVKDAGLFDQYSKESSTRVLRVALNKVKETKGKKK